MNKLLSETQQLLKEANFDWAFCGGWAIDLFLGKQTREHSDIDICVFSETRSDVITFMTRPGWTLYDYTGRGTVHLNTGHDEPEYAGKSLCAARYDNKIFRFVPIGNNFFRMEYQQVNQTAPDFIDFFFNDRNDGWFYCAWNAPELKIKRELDSAILSRDGIPYLAPEIALLFDSREYENSGHDFETSISRMNSKQSAWLRDSLKLCYPEGHPWIDRLLSDNVNE